MSTWSGPPLPTGTLTILSPVLVNEAAGIITHHITGALWPPLVDSDQGRHVTLIDDVLTRSPPSPHGAQSFLRWRRVTASERSGRPAVCRAGVGPPRPRILRS
jgi:hypothetical protein